MSQPAAGSFCRRRKLYGCRSAKGGLTPSGARNTRSMAAQKERGNTMDRTRRSILTLAAAALGLAYAGAAQAQANYPTRPITIIVPFAAGGPTDVITRIVTQHMSQTLGQQFVVENVVGAGGTTGSTRAARAANDGYTLITGHVGTHAASVALYPGSAIQPPEGLSSRSRCSPARRSSSWRRRISRRRTSTSSSPR